MFERDRFLRLESRVTGVLPALDVLDRLRCAPKGMDAVSVLADVLRKGGGTELRKLTFFFTRDGKKDAVCQLDNADLSLVCSSPYPSTPKQDGWEPLDLRAVRVDLDEALSASDRAVGEGVADRAGPDLLVDVLLKSVQGRPRWEISYDTWTREGPQSFHGVHVDAESGAVELVRSDPG